MSDSDNYFSDSDISEKNDEDNNSENSMEDELGSEEMDEEMRLMIYEAFKNRKDKEPEDYSYFSDQVPVSKKEKKRSKKNSRKKKIGLSLQDFQDKIEKEKPKKWMGKRFQDKKGKLGMNDIKVKKRCFNPRLPPPTYKTFKKREEKNQVINTNNEEAFPSLSSLAKDVDV